jgi:creatinine amidohydrolase
MAKIWMQEMTYLEVQEYLKVRDEVIVPIGSTETHGPHLPMGTDTYEAIDYAEEIARTAGILCTPPIWYGDSPHHMHKPGTITLAPETVIAVLKDVYRSLIFHGFKVIITFNGHRLGNLACMNIAARTVKAEHPGVIFAGMDPLLMSRTHLRLRETAHAGDHGGEFETSHMLYRRPELVNREAFVFSHGRYIDSRFVALDVFASGDKMLLYHGWQEQGEVAPLGHVGDPTAASAEKGEALMKGIVAGCVEFLDDIRRLRAADGKARGAAGEAGRRLLADEVRQREE